MTGDGDINAEPYRWLFNRDKGEHNLDVFKKVRENFEDLPETGTTFPSSHLVSESQAKSPFIGGMLRYLGAWPQPQRFTRSDTRGETWVNPHAKWAPKHSDVAVVCECGAVRFSPEYRAERASAYLDEKYSEPCKPDCPSDIRVRTKAKIWDNRRRILETAANYAHHRDMVARRLDIQPGNVQVVARALGYDDWETMKIGGLKRRRATWVKLSNEYDVTYDDIAESFGVTRHLVGDHIRKYPEFFDDK